MLIAPAAATPPPLYARAPVPIYLNPARGVGISTRIGVGLTVSSLRKYGCVARKPFGLGGHSSSGITGGERIALTAAATTPQTSTPWYRNRKSLWNLPNLLTSARVVLIPIFAAVFYLPQVGGILSASIFILAAITDFFDGYLARKWDICSPFGAFLDPVADKLMVSTALILLAGAQGVSVAVPTAIILCREIGRYLPLLVTPCVHNMKGVSALREWTASQGKRDSIAVGWSGKVKTACQMVAISGLLLAQSNPLFTQAVLQTLHQWSLVLLYIATYLTVTSGMVYLRVAYPLLTGTSNGGEELESSAKDDDLARR